MTKAHAFLPFSGAAEWSACPAWATMNATYPDTSDPTAAAEGTASHWAYEEMIRGNVVAPGQITPEGTVLTLEMIEGAELMVLTVNEIRNSNPDATRIHVEEYLAAPRIHMENGGTPDTWLYSPAQQKAWVVEYKYGWELVEVFENRQLANQAAGVAGALELNGLSEQNTSLEMVVVQPRAHHRDGPVRRWRVLFSDLRALWNKLELAAEVACGAVPLAQPGPQCKHCSGRHACDTLKRDAYRSAALIEDLSPLELPPDAAALELHHLRAAAAVLASRISGLEGQIEGLLSVGQAVPGWTLEHTPGREQWTLPAEQVIAMGQMLGVNIAKPVEPLTPLQARKAGMLADVVNANCERKAGSVKLAPVDDSLGRRVFGS